MLLLRFQFSQCFALRKVGLLNAFKYNYSRMLFHCFHSQLDHKIDFHLPILRTQKKKMEKKNEMLAFKGL